MKIVGLVALLIPHGLMSHAACGPDQTTFVACQIEHSSNMLQVCFDDKTATYSFGPENAPDLTLSEPLLDLKYLPWTGAGRSISEAAIFDNGPYSYTAFVGVDRMFGDETEADHPQPHFGGVFVDRDGENILRLYCDRATVDFPWAGDEIFAIKEEAGQVWGSRARVWRDGAG